METINNGMCRCCASEGTFKDVATRYQWMGEEEVYGEMLRECFDITLAASDDGQEAGICEVCITQLRNAANFKKQVQRTEEQFKRRLDDLPFKSNIVKVEASPLEEAVGVSDDDDKYSDEMSLSEYQEIAIKTESSDDTKAKKRSAKATTSRAKQPKLEAETSSKRRNTRSRGKVSEETLTLNKRVNFSTFINIKPSGVSRVRHVERTSQKQKRLTELDLHFDNIKTVVRCSNATPIRCKVGDRYACGYCLDQYMDPRDLKKHTLDKHRDSDDKLECLNIRSLSRYSVHLDVTDLKCTICNDSMNRLEELIEHLKLEHDEPIHSHIRNLMVPYKFESLQLSCAICLQEFDEYSDLQGHMTEHYRNYVCEFCDKAFIMRSVMVEHKKDVHRV
ncbi:zinc finger protein 429-like isoform X8 [Ostrinia nubilalis]|uniref:zinc finger protein 429-like isoform X8 n=1 Tax=Ostrinia nubilalis TaxID=29057 RepID=UPI0030824131